MFIRIWEERLPFVFTAHLLFIQYDRQDSFVLRPKKKKLLFSFDSSFSNIRVCTWVMYYLDSRRCHIQTGILFKMKKEKKLCFFVVPDLDNGKQNSFRHLS